MSESIRASPLAAFALCCVVAALVAVPALGAATAGGASVTVTTETTDGTLSVEVRLTNTGETAGRYTVELVRDEGGLVAERSLRVPANGTRQVVFDDEVSGTVSYTVYVNSVEVEAFTVTMATASTPTDDRRLPEPLLVGLLGAGVVLVIGPVLLWLF
ncbi:MAG: hypothetical protein ABEH90_10890 [Halolamina sp.]